MNSFIMPVAHAVFASIAVALLSVAPASHAADMGFEPIFDGKTLKGWHVSGKTGHSRASTNMTGGKWVVENGAIVGSQDIPGNGGIVITDEHFGDFEVVLEMNNDFGPDSGLFLRSTEDGKAWQAMIDYHQGRQCDGHLRRGSGREAQRAQLQFSGHAGQNPNQRRALPLPVSVEAWPRLWKHGQWNELRARIENNPPTITTWINGTKFMEWKETEKRHPDKGGIALQVHGGGDHTKEFVRYRNIRVKRLTK
jgi:hypothetical protein